MLQKLQEPLRTEQPYMNNEIIQRTQKEVLDVIRKFLSDMTDSTLEENITSCPGHLYF